MYTKTKLSLGIGLLVSMIILLVLLSVINFQVLTAMDPKDPATGIALQRALLMVSVTGVACIIIGILLYLRLPAAINRPIRELTDGILEIANHNYEKRLNLSDNKEFIQVSESFNSMAERLAEYRASSLADILQGKKYIETIVNSITEPIIGLDDDKVILFINDEALSILNMKRENVIRKPATDLALKNDLMRRLIRELITPDEKNEPLNIYADNKESFFQAKYIPIRMLETGETEPKSIGHVIMLKNITEFKELESAKTTFISTISHELKTPISAILMSLQLLEDKRVGELNKEQEELSRSIKDNSERLLSITGELLNMTQVEAGKLQLMPKITKPIELINYAIGANKVQADKFGCQIEVEYPEKIDKLYIDSEKIAWVLTNLLSNAIRFSPEYGRVIIGAKQVDKVVEMYVQDFGKGIDPRYHQSIFDRYFRVPGTKVQGSGLGLSISKDFVEAHNGTISVESELGKGSRFVIRFDVR
ncbi:MAG: ATP-binding protein [Bacteroidota bacterium]|nr:ATP-binding protein [Bacteroidota bacterium]